ncbi:hypothetical protein [Sulfurovum sp.]
MKVSTPIFEQLKVIKAKEIELEQQNIISLQKVAEEIKALLKSSKK